MKDIEKLKKEWTVIVSEVKSIGGETSEIIIERPATIEEVINVEKKLGISLPKDFRDYLLKFSKKVEFYYNFPDEVIIPNEFEIYRGELYWDIDYLENLTELIEVDYDYANELKDKIQFNEAGNGDIWALDVSEDKRGQVVYWDHETGEITYVAANFHEYLEKITDLKIVGSEIWPLEIFIEEEKGLNNYSEKAIEWKEVYHKLIHNSLEQVESDLGSLLSYVLLRGKLSTSELNAFKSFNQQELLKSIEARIKNSTDKRQHFLLSKVVGEVLKGEASEWSLKIWKEEPMQKYICSFLLSKCLEKEQGINIVLEYLKSHEELNSYDWYSNLKYFRDNRIIKEIEPFVCLPVERWSSIVAHSNPTWDDVLHWVNLGNTHNNIMISALEDLIKINNKETYLDNPKIKDCPNKEVLISDLKVIQENQVLNKYKEKIQKAIENIDAIMEVAK